MTKYVIDGFYYFDQDTAKLTEPRKFVISAITAFSQAGNYKEVCVIEYGESVGYIHLTVQQVEELINNYYASRS